MGKAPEGRQIQCLAPRRALKITEVLSHRGEPMGRMELPKAMDPAGGVVLGGGSDHEGKEDSGPGGS